MFKMVEYYDLRDFKYLQTFYFCITWFLYVPVDFKIVYQLQDYKEIKNERYYGLDSLWSNIGGFLGIFVGYSLLNLLNDGYNLITYLLKVDGSAKKSAKIIQK